MDSHTAYTIGSILLDVSIALLLVSPICRLIMIKRYLRKNGNNELTDTQKRKINQIFMPIGCIALALGIASLIMSFL